MRFHVRLALLLAAIVVIFLVYRHSEQTGVPLTSSFEFVLFRSIGNDLPPRHEVGQTYRNVKFILENEKDFPGLEKRWCVRGSVSSTGSPRLCCLWHATTAALKCYIKYLNRLTSAPITLLNRGRIRKLTDAGSSTASSTRRRRSG